MANAASKSANYCHFSKESPDGILILCEVALGKQYVLNYADNLMTKEKLPDDSVSVHGRGKWVPQSMHALSDGSALPMGPLVDASGVIGKSALLYDEHIIYELSRCRMRYIVHFEAVFK